MPSFCTNVKNDIEFDLPTYVYRMDKNFLCRPDIQAVIQGLRRGNLSTTLLSHLVFILLLYGVALQHNPGWG